jgi:hypothetical protein
MMKMMNWNGMRAQGDRAALHKLLPLTLSFLVPSHLTSSSQQSIVWLAGCTARFYVYGADVTRSSQHDPNNPKKSSPSINAASNSIANHPWQYSSSHLRHCQQP